MHRLFAATTLSISMPQSYMLSAVAIRDSGALPAEKMATMHYSFVELSAFLLIATYGILALLAYFIAIGLGDEGRIDSQNSAFASRWLYFQACACYIAGAACVTTGAYRRTVRSPSLSRSPSLLRVALTYSPSTRPLPITSHLPPVVQRRALSLEAATADEGESGKGSDVENGGEHGKGAATSQEATPGGFRCTTKVLALVGLTLAALHRHAVVNGCRMPIGKHFSSGTEGCF